MPVLTVVALGDSLTYSRGSPVGARYCDVLERELCGRLAGAAEVVVVNSGVGGDTAEGGLARFESDVAAHQPDLVLVEFGANDVLRKDPEWFAGNLDALVAMIVAETGADVILSTGPYIDDRRNVYAADEFFTARGGLNAYMQNEMSARIRRIAERRGLKVFDLYKVFADAVGEDERQSTRFIRREDGIHWTEEGDRLAALAMAETAASVLREIAERKTAAARPVAGGPEPLFAPEPKIVERTGGAVRAFNVLSVRRAPQSADALLGPFETALKAARVRLVREGDGWELSIHEADPAEFLPENTPAFACAEGYRLRILPGGATLTAGGRDGFRRGLSTLAQFIGRLEKKRELPAVTVVDWPSMAYRGIFMEDKWGPDLMTLDDWKGVVDRLAERKMNVMGVGLYGCWCVQYDGEVTEFLMVPIPGHPEIKKQWACRWFSPRAGKWEEIRYLPRMFEEDFFGRLVAYGVERGVRVVPFVNSLGHNTLIPRKLPEISAKTADGQPTGYGYCLSNPATWDFLTSFYGSIVDRYLLPNGCDMFHIQMDEVGPARGADPSDPKRVVDPECACPACAARAFGERIQNYVIRLVKFLVSRGMKHVVIWSDQLTRHMDLVDGAFVDRLKAEGIFENLVLHWWWYSNDYIHGKVHPSIGRGLRGWVGPMTCYFNWAYYRPNHRNIANMLAMGHAEGAEGAVSYSVYDAACDFDFSLLADYAWDSRGRGPVRAALEGFCAMSAPSHGRLLAEAIRALDLSAEGTPVVHVCYYTYSYPSPDHPYPLRYPLDALDFFAEKVGEFPELQPGLVPMLSWAKRARLLLELVPAKMRGETERNLLAEAARLEALAGCFLELRRIRAECEVMAEAERSNVKGPDYARRIAVETSRHLAEWFSGKMRVVEANKPDYMVPSCLRDMSVMYEFLLQLKDDAAQAAEGKRSWAEIRWFVERCVAQRGLQERSAEG